MLDWVIIGAKEPRNGNGVRPRQTQKPWVARLDKWICIQIGSINLPDGHRMSSGMSSGYQLGKSQPAQHRLTCEGGPETRDETVVIVKQPSEGPVYHQKDQAPNRQDGRQMTRNQRRVMPFPRTELQRCVDQAEIENHPDLRDHDRTRARRTQQAVYELPGDVCASNIHVLSAMCLCIAYMPR